MGHDVRMLCFLFAALDVFGEYGGFVVVYGYREAAPEVGVLDHGGRGWCGESKTVGGAASAVLLAKGDVEGCRGFERPIRFVLSKRWGLGCLKTV
jgi:hypothetical protein